MYRVSLTRSAGRLAYIGVLFSAVHKNARFSIPAIAVAVTSLALAGCPADTSVPLVAPKDAIATSVHLTGNWKCTGEAPRAGAVRISDASKMHCYYLDVTAKSDEY